MNDFQETYDKLINFGDSEGIAKASLMMYCFVLKFGWEAAKTFYPKATFYRNKWLLDFSGLSNDLPEYSNRNHETLYSNPKPDESKSIKPMQAS